MKRTIGACLVCVYKSCHSGASQADGHAQVAAKKEGSSTAAHATAATGGLEELKNLPKSPKKRTQNAILDVEH